MASRWVRALLAVSLLAGAACAGPSTPSPSPAAAPTPRPTVRPSVPPPASPSPVVILPTASLTAAATTTATARPSATPRPARPRVVLISVDGLRPDAITPATMPNLLALAQRGSYTFQAQTIYPPATLPAHTSMFTGQLPETHGVTWNDYAPARGVITATTFFGLAHAAGLRTALIAGKEKFAHFNTPEALDVYTFARGGDPEVVDEALRQAAAGVDVLGVHLPNPDYFGHLTGWMSPVYVFQLSRTDAALGRLLAALPADTVVLVTADHGGLDFTHGRRIPEDLTIPWIIAGPGVRVNAALSDPVNIVDTAATLAYLLGLTLPPEAAGRPVLAALAPAP